MVLTSSLADALNTSDVNSADNPGTAQPSGAGLEAQPEPDASSLPPNSTTPTGSENLQGSLTPQNNPAQSQPLSATPPPPAGLQGLGGRLRGVLYGLATGGAVGAVAGAIAPNDARAVYQNRQAVQAANVRFASARAAEMVANANRADAAYQNFDSDHQLAVQQQQLGILDEAQKAGFVVRAVTPLDQGTAKNTQAAMNNLQQITASDGAVGEMLHLHVGDKTMSLQLRDPNAGLDLVNSRLTAQGLPKIDQGTWANYSQDARNSLGIDAMNFTDPGRGHVTPDTLTTLQNRIGLVKAQSDFTGKDALVSSLQSAIDTQTSILDRANERQVQQKAQEITTTGAATTANQVSNIKATAGPEAAAAGQKAEATAKGSAKGAIEGQMSALGGSTTTGTMNPATGADEGFLSQLPQQQANTIRAIGEGRVELNSRTMASKDGKLLMQQLTTAYPNFDQSKAQSYFKTRQDFTSGKTSVGINSYNTAIAHLGTMWDHVSSTNSLMINTPGTQVHRQLDLDKQLVSTELAKAVSNGQMTQKEKDDILGSISGYTVGSYQDRIQEAATLLNGKLESYQQQWNNGAPPGAVSQVRILGPQAEATIAKIRGGAAAQQIPSGPPPGASHAVIVNGKTVGYTSDGKTMTPAPQ
jgi:hypothetical protein